jgi:4-hydroxybenzoate polyprenyltransferase
VANLRLVKNPVEVKSDLVPGEHVSGHPILVVADLVRLSHWIKNLLLFVPPFFAGTLMGPLTVSRALPAFLAMSLMASVGYIINDIQDIESDRMHPRKRFRPLACGVVSTPLASVAAGLLSAGALLLAREVSPWFPAYVLGYLAISLAYSCYFKHVFLVDIFLIASGFIVRLLAGGEAFGVEITSWLFLTMFFVSLFMAAGKRMGEVVSLREWASSHRVTLLEYSPDFLRSVLWTAAASSLLTYALYTTEGHHRLFYTVPLATFGMFRYLFLLSRKQESDPTELLLHDKVLFTTFGLWTMLVALMMYGPLVLR